MQRKEADFSLHFLALGNYKPCSNLQRRLIPMKKLTKIATVLVIVLIMIGWSASQTQAATAQVTIRGSWLASYTVQIWQNGVLRAQNTGITLPLGYRIVSFSNLPSGCGYIANVWVNGVGIQSHTWPSKCVSGTTHLGCLQFNMAGEPEPWSGNCP
jgi:hypothetical protein